MQHHGLHLIRKSDIERSCDLKELLKLKRCEIFMIPDGLEYGMIKKIGLYQNILRQFLSKFEDFIKKLSKFNSKIFF